MEAYVPTRQLEAELIATKNALRESDARFHTLADALPHMVWSTLPDGYHVTTSIDGGSLAEISVAKRMS